MIWVCAGLAALLLLDALRVRVRLASLAVLEPSGEGVSSDHRFLLAPGVVLDDQTRRAASAYARAHGLALLDLLPRDLPVANAMGILQIIDPRRLRADPRAIQPARVPSHRAPSPALRRGSGRPGNRAPAPSDRHGPFVAQGGPSRDLGQRCDGGRVAWAGDRCRDRSRACAGAPVRRDCPGLLSPPAACRSRRAPPAAPRSPVGGALSERARPVECDLHPSRPAPAVRSGSRGETATALRFPSRGGTRAFLRAAGRAVSRLRLGRSLGAPADDRPRPAQAGALHARAVRRLWSRLSEPAPLPRGAGLLLSRLLRRPGRVGHGRGLRRLAGRLLRAGPARGGARPSTALARRRRWPRPLRARGARGLSRDPLRRPRPLREHRGSGTRRLGRARPPGFLAGAGAEPLRCLRRRLDEPLPRAHPRPARRDRRGRRGAQAGRPPPHRGTGPLVSPRAAARPVLDPLVPAAAPALLLHRRTGAPPAGRGLEPLVRERGEAHRSVDFSLAAWMWLGRVAPPSRLPWRPPGSVGARLWRGLVWTAGAPFLIASWGMDRLLAPLLRRPGWSNAYRVLARKGDRRV